MKKEDGQPNNGPILPWYDNQQHKYPKNLGPNIQRTWGSRVGIRIPGMAVPAIQDRWQPISIRVMG